MSRKPGHVPPGRKPVLKSAKKPPAKAPAKPKKPAGIAPKTGRAPPKLSTYRNSLREGSADRWEKVDRRPILIGGGCLFLLLILGVAFYIGKVMKKDQEEQSKLNAEKKEIPKFKIGGPAEVIKTESTETSASDKPLTPQSGGTS